MFRLLPYQYSNTHSFSLLLNLSETTEGGVGGGNNTDQNMLSVNSGGDTPAAAAAAAAAATSNRAGGTFFLAFISVGLVHVVAHVLPLHLLVFLFVCRHWRRSQAILGEEAFSQDGPKGKWRQRCWQHDLTYCGGLQWQHCWRYAHACCGGFGLQHYWWYVSCFTEQNHDLAVFYVLLAHFAVF